MSLQILRGNSAAAIPGNPPVGTLYFDTGRLALLSYNGSSWVEVKARTMPLVPSMGYPHAVICHSHDQRSIDHGLFEGMPLEPCERWLFDQGLYQNEHFVSYYDFVPREFDGLHDYKLLVRFKNADHARMFNTVWGGQKVKSD